MIRNCITKNKLLLKTAGFGLLSALLVLVFSVAIAELLYQPKTMVKRGFEVEVQTIQKDASPQDVGGVKVGDLKDLKANSKAQPKAVNIAEMLKTADIDAGAKVFKKCATCHSVENGGANKVGPNLYGVVGKKKAAVAGFAYSPALKAKGGVWTIEDLNQWITKPKDFVPGTKMGFAGLKKDKDRANVILYLKSRN